MCFERKEFLFPSKPQPCFLGKSPVPSYVVMIRDLGWGEGEL